MFTYEDAWESLKKKLKSLQSTTESSQKKEAYQEILTIMNEKEYLAVCFSIVRGSSHIDDD